MARKKIVKRTSKKISRKIKSSEPRNKIKLVFNNLILFIALSIISLIIFNFVSNSILVNLFQIMIISFGFISASLLIALLILLIIKMVREGNRKKVKSSSKKKSRRK
jgi:predicted neutral ceramidase superfamily lipid hydrolase